MTGSGASDPKRRPGLRPARLYGIEALRGVAATIVVLSHVARHIDKAYGAPALIALFQAGHAGVDLFFTLSGFVILFVHRADVGRPSRLAHYAERRFGRVWPLYWIALLVTVLMMLGGGHAISAAAILWSATLLPTAAEPVLGIAWTLQYEVVFYALFAALIAHRRAGIALMTLWLVVVVVTAIDPRPRPMPSPVDGIYVVEFFLGMAAAHVLGTRAVPMPGRLAVLAGGLFVAALVAESAGRLDGFGVAARFAYGVPAAALILGLAAAERGGRVHVPGWLRTLGGASYSIYLFQFVFIGIVWQIMVRAGVAGRIGQPALFVILTVAGLGGGIAVARWIERPLLRALRRGDRPARES